MRSIFVGMGILLVALLAGCTGRPPPLLNSVADMKAEKSYVIFRTRGEGLSGRGAHSRPDPEVHWLLTNVPKEKIDGLSNRKIGNQYAVYELSPGTYELYYTEWRGMAVMYQYHRLQALFTVKEGEVVYLGDMVFSRGANTFLVDFVDQRDAATAYLGTKFPELKDKMITRLGTVGQKKPKPTANKQCWGIWNIAYVPLGFC